MTVHSQISGSVKTWTLGAGIHNRLSATRNVTIRYSEISPLAQQKSSLFSTPVRLQYFSSPTAIDATAIDGQDSRGTGSSSAKNYRSKRKISTSGFESSILQSKKVNQVILFQSKKKSDQVNQVMRGSCRTEKNQENHCN